MKKVMKRIPLILMVTALITAILVTPAMAADAWVSDSDIVAGLAIDYGYSNPTVFNMDGTWYLISGAGYGEFYGFYWHLKRSRWVSDSNIVSGLTIDTWLSSPDVFCMNGTWYLISGEREGAFYGFYWTGSTWQSDPAIVSGLTDIGGISDPTVFCMDGTWYLISGEAYGGFYAFRWTGSTWQSDSAIVSGLTDIGDSTKPDVFYKDGTWYLISGKYRRNFCGYTWTGLTWQSDPAIVSGLGDIGYFTTPDVFNKDGTWYLISGSGKITEGAFYGWHYQYPTKPDLISTTLNVPELFVDLPGTINVTIANVGVLDASAFNVSLSANGEVVDKVSVPSLGAGNSTNVSFEWTSALGGDHELCVVADSDNEIAEIDEVNNKKSILVTVN